MFQDKATVIVCQQCGPIYWHMVLYAPRIAATAQPGQFVHLLCGSNMATMLRRPLSINGVDSINGTIDLLFELRGQGTLWLSRQEANSEIDIIGPLGNHFTFVPGCRRILLISGGVGVAPLYYLAQVAVEKELEVDFLLRAQNKAMVLKEQELKNMGVRLTIITRDGSAGQKGNVMDLLPRLFTETTPQQLFVCGTQRMSMAVKEFAARVNCPCQVSLEGALSCGVGVCQGCVVKAIDAQGRKTYRKICSDGPVFDAQEVVFDEE